MFSEREGPTELDPLLLSNGGGYVTTSEDILVDDCIDGEDGNGEGDGDDDEDEGTSTIPGCTVNVTNAILGAGCIGYGGAVARSGGFISILLILVIAIMTKWSFDLLIDLGIQYHADSYEALGTRAGGITGRISVILAKGLFSFGCMVAYIVIIKDNLAAGCRGIMTTTTTTTRTTTTTLLEESKGDFVFWSSDMGATLVVCLIAMLPLSLLRDVTPLERFSSVKVITYGAILAIVIHLYFTLPPPQSSSSDLTFVQKWLVVKPGVCQSMGTMVLAFVASHTQHLFFRSLRPQYRNLQSWKTVSTFSVAIACVIYMGMALFAYMTYWDKTSSDLFQQYPSNLLVVNVARIFLSFAMILTYPMPMFSLRELIAASLFDIMVITDEDVISVSSTGTNSYPAKADEATARIMEVFAPPTTPTGFRHAYQSWESHVLLTLVLWALTFMLAITAGSLGDVLNLIGCASGTLIGFVLPGIFSYRLQGYTRIGTLLLVVGGLVGCLGTWFSLQEIIYQ